MTTLKTWVNLKLRKIYLTAITPNVVSTEAMYKGRPKFEKKLLDRQFGLNTTEI